MPNGRKQAPKPGPPPALQRWFQERQSPYPWEQDGLDHIKRLMPQAEPYRAWATFSFTGASGRVNECDLLIAVPGGLYLVELKGHPGKVINNGDTWSSYAEGARHPRTLRNPLHLTDMKSKELKTRLEWAAKQLHISQRIPRVEPAVFLSAPDLRAALDEVQRTRVYARDADSGLPEVWRDLLAAPPQRENQRISPEFSRHILPQLLEKVGISASTAHLRFGDDWMLSPDLLDAGPTWEDRLASRDGIVREQGRVRIYLTEQQAGEQQRQSVERAARREYQILQGTSHRGIAQAVQIREHHGGPAILFDHRESDLRLDSYMDLHGDSLSIRTRLDMVRQLAEAVAYAHSRSLYHRALAARSVYVSAADDGSEPLLRIIDWQTAARDFETTSMSSLGNSSLTGEHVATAAEVYLAPEFDASYPDPVDLDMFGLGALAFLLLTGVAPASQRNALIEALEESQGLHPYAVSDGISDALDGLIFDATRNDVARRMDSAETFLKRLDGAERESLPESAEPTVDPLDASVGQVVDDDWVVERVLGTGATARALLVSRTSEDDDGNVRTERRVFKIALDEQKSGRLRAEAQALRSVGGGVIVQLLDGPRMLSGRTMLDLEYAAGQAKEGADRTLGEQVRAEGRLTYHQLERFGKDLFTALDHLAGKGVRHRDLKPDNFGVYYRADRSTQLMLFDFSLADVSERDVKAGTRAYLDPFLGTNRRPAYDDHAERYAAAVTLHEMASGQRPVWGDGLSDPRTTDDETPILAAEEFEPALRDGLSEFFLRAFHRDVDRRFDTLRQMDDAWRRVFDTADAAKPITTPGTVDIEESGLAETRDAHADAATLDTPLDAAGLSPRAVSVAHSFNATTVGELLDVRLYEIARARGAGKLVRNELNRRHKQWSKKLSHGKQTPAPSPREGGQYTVEDLTALITPKPGRKGSSRSETIRLTLGLPNGEGTPQPWPRQSEVAGLLNITQASVSNHYRAALKSFATEQRLSGVRDDLVQLLADSGRVSTASELAAALRARHGTAEDAEPERTTARAIAVVRAAVDTEEWEGAQRDAVDDPRMLMLRRGERVLIALDSLPGSNDPSAPELVDYAVALGRRADELVRTEPLPGRGVVVRELRAMPTPEGLASQADTRLVELAASMSEQAAASPRLELYPTELDLVRALRISQAAAGVRRDPGVSKDDLLAKVRARFPALELDERMTHVELEDALRKAGFPLEFDTNAKVFRPPVPELSALATSSGTTLSGHGRLRAQGLDPQEALAGTLNSAIERGGFRALTLKGQQLPGTAEALSATYRVRPVHVDREFLTTLRALTSGRGHDWDKVGKLDAQFEATGTLPRGLASYVRTAWDQVRQALLERAEPTHTVLFLHHASLLGRYMDHGGHELLTSLQQCARRPHETPHGMWLLCPAESARDTPQLEHHIVEVESEAERVALDKDFLTQLRSTATGAA